MRTLLTGADLVAAGVKPIPLAPIFQRPDGSPGASPLRPALAAQSAEVLPYGTTVAPSDNASRVEIRPYRPRARALPAPVGATPLDRLRVLTDSSAAPAPGETIDVGPAESAARIIEVLRGWGYLELAD